MSKFLKQTSIVFLALSFGAICFAFETAFVLPKKGLMRARVVGVFTDGINQTYNEDGKLELTAIDLNQRVNLSTFLQTATPVEQQQALGLISALNTLKPGLGDLLLGTNSQLGSDFNFEAQTLVPAVEYAYSKNLTLGFRIPIVKRNFTIRLKSQFTDIPALAAAELGSDLSPELTAGLNALADKFPKDAAGYRAEFVKRGYRAPEDFSDTNIGDAEIGAKWNFYKNYRTLLSTQVGLRLPTGSIGDLDNFFDNGTGGGAWALGLSAFQETEILPNLAISAMQDVRFFLPDTQLRVVPLNTNDLLPNLLNQTESVTRTQQPRVQAALSARYRILEGAVYFSGTYGASAQGKSKFTGERDFYYEGLAEQPREANRFNTYANLQIGYSSIPSFKRKEISVPFETRLQYYTTVDGKNANLVDYFRTEVLFYF